MRCFLLFTTLATATAEWKASYTTAKQGYEGMFKEWSTGETDFASYFSDDAIGDIPTDFADPATGVKPGAYPHAGPVKIKDIGFVEYFGQFTSNGLSPFTDLKFSIFEKDAHEIIVDISLKAVGFDKINRRYGMFVRYRSNADNKCEYYGWTMYSVERLDAASVGNKFYAAWKAGDIATVLGTFTQDIKMSASGDRVHGNLVFNGQGEWMKFMTDNPDDYKDDLSQFKYSVSSNSADGTSASGNVEIIRTYKNGAKFHSKAYQSWVVNCDGKVTEMWTTYQSETPMNPRATFDDLLSSYGRGDMDGVFATYSPNMKIAYGGATKNLEYWPTYEWKRGEVYDKDTFVAFFPKQMSETTNQKLNPFKFIAEGDKDLIIRYDMTYDYKGKRVHWVADFTHDFDENFKIQNCFGNILEIEVSDIAAPKDL